MQRAPEMRSRITGCSPKSPGTGAIVATRPTPVGTKQPNASDFMTCWGTFPSGSLNRYFNKYDFDSAETGPRCGTATGFLMRRRRRAGGFWENDASGLRVSRRLEQEKEGDQIPIGFRCARDKP